MPRGDGQGRVLPGPAATTTADTLASPAHTTGPPSCKRMVRVCASRRMFTTKVPASAEECSILDKTKMCKFYGKGKCCRGKSCTFAHTAEQLQPRPNFLRTQLCFKYARAGSCWLGSSCKFAHSCEEIRPIILRAPPTEGKLAPKRGRRNVMAAQGSGMPQAGTGLQCQSEKFHQHAAQLLEQLQALRANGVTSRLKPRADSRDGIASPMSCLSTEEGDNSRQVSEEFEEHAPTTVAYQDGDGCSMDLGVGFADQESQGLPSEWISEEGLQLAGAAGLTLAVRNTFITAEPIGAAGPAQYRRARSAPRLACSFGSRAET